MLAGPIRPAGYLDRRISFMSEALKLIVDGYLSLKNHEALEDIRAHRQRLRKQLAERTPGGIDAGPAIEALDEDLRVIEAAIARH
jgi:hypothetical protein